MTGLLHLMILIANRFNTVTFPNRDDEDMNDPDNSSEFLRIFEEFYNKGDNQVCSPILAMKSLIKECLDSDFQRYFNDIGNSLK